MTEQEIRSRFTGSTGVLNLHGAKSLTDGDLVYLGKLGPPPVRYLFLSSTGVTDAGLKHLQQLSHLEELELQSTKVTDAGMLHLVNLGSLKRLVLLHTSISDAGVAHLQQLAKPLQELNLGGTLVSDAGMPYLGKLTGVNRLDLSYTSVGDDGLVYLSQLSSLRLLDLEFTKVTDAGLLRHFGAGAFVSLKQLVLTGTGVTTRGRLELNRRLPDLAVVIR